MARAFIGPKRPVKGGGGRGALALATGLQAAAGGFTQFTRGKIEKRLSKAQRRALRKEAQRAKKRGKQAEARIRQRGKRVTGAARASAAAQGIRVGAGSARDIQFQTEDITELDALTARNNAARQALGFEKEAIRAGTRGDIAFQKGKGEAAQTLLTGGIQAFRRFKGV